jgi:hypothetical protein
MTQTLRDLKKIEYKLKEDTPINKYEMNAYNVPFYGNTSTCREVFVKGERILEFSVDGDMSVNQIIKKPLFRDELVEYVYSLARQMGSLVQNGLSLGKVVWDSNYMFVRLSDFSIQLIYLPLDEQYNKKDIAEFTRRLLGDIVYAHTPAIETANQIIDYMDEHKDLDVFKFIQFITELRSSSQLLTIQGEQGRSEILAETKGNDKEIAIHKAEEAAKKAEAAKIQAENEVKRQTEEAKRQAEIAKKAEDMRLKAEAARIEAEIWRQRATAEVRDFEQTAVLTSQNSDEFIQDNYSEDMIKAEDEKLRAEQASSMYAEEIRKAREQEMQAEEARIRAEFAARKNAEEARRQADLAKRQSDEAKRLSEQDDSEPATTLFTNRTLVSGNIPSLIRKSTGEVIDIDKQVFCIGKADQGVDYKITGNKSISRRHAYITSINGVNYLRDNNSTNHTFINGTQVYSNMDVVIPDNSIIRLSNEEFLFRSHS